MDRRDATMEDLRVDEIYQLRRGGQWRAQVAECISPMSSGRVGFLPGPPRPSPQAAAEAAILTARETLESFRKDWSRRNLRRAKAAKGS